MSRSFFFLFSSSPLSLFHRASLVLVFCGAAHRGERGERVADTKFSTDNGDREFVDERTERRRKVKIGNEDGARLFFIASFAICKNFRSSCVDILKKSWRERSKVEENG